jgi:hypothetical protein
MTRQTSPHASADESAKTAVANDAIGMGIVTSAPTQTDNGETVVSVQSATVPTDGTAVVLPNVHGDSYVPPKGTPVLLAQLASSETIVLKAPTPNVDSPTLDEGERIISHPTSESVVKFNADGTLDIHGDGVVRINGGSKGAITDITTSTDGDGHVTDVSVTRNDDVLL